MKTNLRKLDSVTHNDTTSTKLINDNFQALQEAVEDCLSRSGKTPNYMDAELDLNSRRIINVGEATEDTDVVNKKYVDDKTSEAVEAAKQAKTSAQIAKDSANTAVVNADRAAAVLPSVISAKDSAISTINTAVATAESTINDVVDEAINDAEQASAEAVSVCAQAKAAAEALAMSAYTKAEVDAKIVDVEAHIEAVEDEKQDTLTAGANITIENNVISASGGLTEVLWGGITGDITNQTDLQTALSGKQDTIQDLETIRTGARLGATALQNIPDTYATKTYVTSQGYITNSYHDSSKADSNLSNITTAGQTVINNLIDAKLNPIEQALSEV